MLEQSQGYLNQALDMVWKYGPNLLFALVMLFGGLWVIRRISRSFGDVLQARHVDESLRPFFTSLVDVGMKVVLLLMVAGRLGFETTSFIAVFSALAFAIGLALQGSLGNFASGVLVLLFRPYKVGDHLVVADKEGDVAEIQIFNTVLKTNAGKRIVIPNGKMTEGPIECVGKTDLIRRDVMIVVKAETSLALLRPVAEEVIRKSPFYLPEHPPVIQVTGFPADGMKLEFGCWMHGEHFDDSAPYLLEHLKNAFDAVGIKLAEGDEKH